MTCIAGLVHNGIVYMGGDSSGVEGWDMTVRIDEKVFRNSHLLIGFTGSFRFGQILRYHFVPPIAPSSMDAIEYVTVHLIPVMRECLKEHGFARIESNREEGARCLIGYAGRLFLIDSDYQVGEALDEFQAIGCGAQVAHGALFANRRVTNPLKRLRTALEAAERFSAGVRGPFNYEVLV